MRAVSTKFDVSLPDKVMAQRAALTVRQLLMFVVVLGKNKDAGTERGLIDVSVPRPLGASQWIRFSNPDGMTTITTWAPVQNSALDIP